MARTITRAAQTDAVQAFEEKHRHLAYEAAVESIVLLENKGVLPLAPGAVALFGAGAEKTVKGGTGSGEVNERHSISIREGLEQAGFSVTTKTWLAAYDRACREAEEAYAQSFRKRLYRLQLKQLANLMHDPFSPPVGPPITEKDLEEGKTDTCIYVVARQAGEGSDRSPAKFDDRLTPEEQRHIAFCAAHFDKLILVINVGGVFRMDFLDRMEGIGAVLFYGQQGGMGGLALAKLLTGEHTPSGRLADTWAAYEDIPFGSDYSHLNGKPEEEDYREDIYVGYRYFDSFGKTPRYPFGYGLSYTRFRMEAASLQSGQRMFLSVQVTNEGERPGAQVVQLYASCPQTGSLPKEYQRLVAFGKTKVLQPGETEVLKLSFSPEDLASYRESDHATVLEKGCYLLRLGENSRNTKPVWALELKEEAVLYRHSPLCCPQKELDRLWENQAAWELPPVPVETLQPPKTHMYIYEEPGEDMPALTERQQARLCVGGGMFRRRSVDAPGAAGVTTDLLQNRGIPQVVLADGPAGLRLAQQSVRLKNGQIKPVEPAMEVMGYLPEFVKGFLCGDPRKGELLWQFTTAFPVELALAQTWNAPLLEQVGQAVGREMEAYGVSFWLAPALNIHRNPLCGRNFEYYSEDPLLSGHLAAAVTRGVQSIPGRFVTLKHFACNNQEQCRNTTDARVSVRALREIYLRGFRIAMEARPEAVMSSYNRLNGVYTANSRDLLTKILRCEWGFGGIVMSDWLSTGPGLARDGEAIAAGNDLIMPGSGANVRRILRALKKGRLTSRELATSAARICRSLGKTK